MSEFERVFELARRQLAAAEAELFRQLVRRYRAAVRPLLSQVERRLAQIPPEQFWPLATTALPAWVERETRRLLARLPAELAEPLAAALGRVIEPSALLALTWLSAAGVPSPRPSRWTPVIDPGRVEQALAALPAVVAQQATQTLAAAAAAGLHPRQAARQLSAAAGVGLTRALTIARTELVTAHREATLAHYRANDDVVLGWIWYAAADLRTCRYCWAMHGKVFALDDPFVTHPNCRCVPAPLTALTPASALRSGAERFAALPPAQQRAVLGPLGYEAYRQGLVTLEDFARVRHDPHWGPVAAVPSLRQLLGPDTVERLRRGARRAA